VDQLMANRVNRRWHEKISNVLKPNFSGETKNVLKNHKSSMIDENTFKKHKQI